MNAKLSRHHEMKDINTCTKCLRELIDGNYLHGIENPTHEDFEHCAREWWVGDN